MKEKINPNVKWIWTLFLILIFMPQAGISAQDDIGGFGDFGDFGFGDFGFGDGASSFSVSIGGDVQAELKGFFEDTDSAEKMKN